MNTIRAILLVAAVTLAMVACASGPTEPARTADGAVDADAGVPPRFHGYFCVFC